ncbi:bifunctional 3-propionate/3-hydroxycinnamic acid hydroxylase [Hyaloscypha variabilis]
MTQPEVEQTDQPILQAHSTCDVVVVGYGPVGMVLSGLLAQHGLKVIVVEKHAQRYALSRAGHVDGETMRTFQRLHVAEKVELIARPATSLELVTADRTVLQNAWTNKQGAGWKPSYLLYQPELEAILHERLCALGVAVYMGMSATAVEQMADHSILTVRETGNGKLEGTESTIEAAFVIGADGANSFIRTAMGAEVTNLGFPAVDNLVLDFEHNDPDRDIPLLRDNRIVLDPRRPNGAGRWSGGRWSRCEYTRNEGESFEELESEETCWKILATWGITPKMGRIDRRAIHTFTSTVSSTWGVGRIFLVGDAAHTMPPFMGQGMCSGLRDAVSLSWKLAEVLSGRADMVLLQTYEEERSPHVVALTKLAMKIGNLVHIRNPILAFLRNLALRCGRLPPPTMPRLGGPLLSTREDATDSVGRPGWQARVALGTRVDLLDNFLNIGWRVVSRHKVSQMIFNSSQKALVEALKLQFAHVTRGDVEGSFIDIDGEYDAWFRKHDRKLFLERPDNYVFAVMVTVEELPGVLDELAERLAAVGWKGLK